MLKKKKTPWKIFDNAKWLVCRLQRALDIFQRPKFTLPPVASLLPLGALARHLSIDQLRMTSLLIRTFRYLNYREAMSPQCDIETCRMAICLERLHCVVHWPSSCDWLMSLFIPHMLDSWDGGFLLRTSAFFIFFNGINYNHVIDNVNNVLFHVISTFSRFFPTFP